jgi:hypothetical protein
MKNVNQIVKKSKLLASNDIFIFCESYGEAFHPTSPSAHYPVAKFLVKTTDKRCKILF